MPANLGPSVPSLYRGWQFGDPANESLASIDMTYLPQDGSPAYTTIGIANSGVSASTAQIWTACQ